MKLYSSIISTLLFFCFFIQADCSLFEQEIERGMTELSDQDQQEHCVMMYKALKRYKEQRSEHMNSAITHAFWAWVWYKGAELINPGGVPWNISPEALVYSLAWYKSLSNTVSAVSYFLQATEDASHVDQALAILRSRGDVA